MRSFRAKYRIPPTVGMRYAAQGEWADDRKTGEVVIPMIAFIEGGMTIPMGTITRSYLRYFRLSLTQCAPNMFRVLGSIEALNERINLNLTHHDVNWVYNLNHLKGQGYYLKSRFPTVRLIQCLPTSNKNLKEDFSYFFGAMKRWLRVSNGRGRTRWGCTRFLMNFGLHFLFFFFFFSIFLLLTKPHFNSMILQIGVIRNPNSA